MGGRTITKTELVSERLRRRSWCQKDDEGGCHKYYDDGVGVRKMTIRELVSKRWRGVGVIKITMTELVSCQKNDEGWLSEILR